MTTFPATSLILTLLFTGLLAWMAGALLAVVFAALGVARAVRWVARVRRGPGKRRARPAPVAVVETEPTVPSLLSVSARCPVEGRDTLHAADANGRTCRECSMRTEKHDA